MKQKRINWRYLAILAIILAFFVAIVSTSYPRMIWFDESYTANLIEGNFSQIANMAALDVHPPLFYWLLHIWYLIFGHSLVALRSFSTFCAVIALICINKLMIRWSKSAKVSLFLTAILAACPFFIYYASEMRMYALVCAIVAAALAFR